MIYRTSIYLIFISAFVFLSCQKENESNEEKVDYLLNFQEEAKQRGIFINYENNPVDIKFQLHSDVTALGWCNYNSDRPNEIILNTFYWDLHNNLKKEQLVFHELGHCILKRKHLDLISDNGYCKSIMHSGQRCSDNYNVKTREKYLDELFLRR